MKKKRHVYDYPRPMLTADGAVFTLLDGELSSLFIRRRYDPFAGRWALPGGFVDENEPLVQAARRELLEETGIRAKCLRFFGAFGDPGRDPRGWTVTVSFYVVIGVNKANAIAGDDAAEVSWKSATRPPDLAFDHRPMLAEAVAQLRDDIYWTPVALPLLRREFTSEDLERVYKILDPACPADVGVEAILRERGVIEISNRSRLRFCRAGKRRPRRGLA